MTTAGQANEIAARYERCGLTGLPLAKKLARHARTLAACDPAVALLLGIIAQRIVDGRRAGRRVA